MDVERAQAAGQPKPRWLVYGRNGSARRIPFHSRV